MVLITVASVGIELTGVSVRLAAAALVAAGLAVPLREPTLRFDRGEALAAAGGAAALVVALLIQNRVIGETPVPGNDWAKYVLYADEIARHGALLIDNPYWMLGVPFREDPGVPALYGAHLLMTGAPAAVLQQGIGLFALAQVGALYALARSLWGGLAGVVAACLWAALPLGYTLLGWHGLANAAALALLALLLLYLADFARGPAGSRRRRGRRAADRGPGGGTPPHLRHRDAHGWVGGCGRPARRPGPPGSSCGRSRLPWARRS